MKRKIVLELPDKELDKLVKISGTEYDRRRKLSDKQIENARRMFKRGKTLDYIANKYNVHRNTIRYHIDMDYRRYRIDHANYRTVMACDRRNYNSALTERANYKRQLIACRKVTF